MKDVLSVLWNQVRYAWLGVESSKACALPCLSFVDLRWNFLNWLKTYFRSKSPFTFLSSRSGGVTMAAHRDVPDDETLYSDVETVYGTGTPLHSQQPSPTPPPPAHL